MEKGSLFNVLANIWRGASLRAVYKAKQHSDYQEDTHAKLLRLLFLPSISQKKSNERLKIDYKI